MRQRRVIVIIGGIAGVLLLLVVGLAVYFLHALEKEKNRQRTAPARDRRWDKQNNEKEQIGNGETTDITVERVDDETAAALLQNAEATG